MSVFCNHCGSRNHASFDCTKQDQTYVPTPADLEQEAAAQPQPEPLKPAAEPEPMFEAGPPRFNGCPRICTAVNLPSHESEAAAWVFHERYSPRCKVLKVGRCKVCDGWHMRTVAPSPAGETSGTTRDSRLPPGFVPFRRRVRESSFEGHGGTAELPRREVEEKPVKKLEPKPKKAIKSTPSEDLFAKTK